MKAEGGGDRDGWRGQEWKGGREKGRQAIGTQSGLISGKGHL